MESKLIRADIQILRAFAVIAVVAFHFKIPGFGNGFLGVDVFFVISGYLMAQMYKKGDAKAFYLRRAKRLFPAYFFTITVTMLLALLIAVSSDFGQVLEQSKAALLLIPNLYFWSQDSYFSTNHFNPLLHLWSIGVEFQFYLLVPFVYWLRNRWISIRILGLSSLLACILILGISPKTSFFLTPFRFWEFITGFLVFRFNDDKRQVGNTSKEIIALLLLLALIGITFFPTDGFSLSFVSGHPGIASIIVTIGTALFIRSNFNFKPNFLNKSLYVIGNYSYSIYLVHFPILVFYFYKPFNGTVVENPTFQSLLIGFLLLAVSAWILHNYVEKRYRSVSLGLKHIAILGITLSLLIPTINLFKFQSYSKIEKNISSAYFDRATYRCGKLFRVLNPTKSICRTTSKAGNDSVLLLGNSHADSIKEIFASEAQRQRITSYFWVQNNPLMGSNPNISEVVDTVKQNGIKAVFFHYSVGAVEEKILNRVIKEFDSAGVKFVILGPVPTWNHKVPERMWQYKEDLVNLDLNQSYDQFLDLNLRALTELTDAVSKFKVPYFDLAAKLCTTNCRYKSDDGHPFYWDEGHLTLTGAKVLGPVLAEALSLSISN